MKEEAKPIKGRLQNCSLDVFSASDGWLDRWKTSYAIKEHRIVGKYGNVSEETVTFWMERLQELTTGYSSENIWIMDGFGYFFEPLPDKRLIEKGKQVKGGKKPKQRCMIDFFVNAVREKVKEPVVIWKSGIPRCFRG